MGRDTVPFPDCDIWSFLFERKTKPFSDQQRKWIRHSIKLFYTKANFNFIPALYTCSQTGRSYTYADVERTARQFGTGLVSHWSWEKDDVLTLFTPNCIDTPAVTWGCHWAGGIVSLANPRNNSIGLTRHLKHSGSKALITQNSCLPTALKAAAQVGLPRSRILLVGDEKNQSGEIRHFTSLLVPSECNRPLLTIRPDVDLAFLVYTSGTTGLAKGAMVTHSNVVAHLVMANTVDGRMLKPGIDKVLAVLPYYHIYGN
jgi:acyl-CoA synthetase (AMP-forming)/AMP-acid ligase II